jgi:phosphohistidine phosphatase SixA
MRTQALWAVTIILAGSLLLLTADVSANQAQLIEQLKSGGHILMLRHALAPGSGDPSDFDIGDCSTQRNLNEAGRQQARRIGNWLRTNGIQSARVYSSQWCRCLETAALLEVGPVQELAALNSFYERTQDREPNLRALKEFIFHQPADGKLIILVTHFVTISGMTGQGVSSGEGILIALHQNEPFTVVGHLEFRD